MRHLPRVNNSVLETAVSVLESDETDRKMFIDCEDTNVNSIKFKRRFEGTEVEYLFVNVYKNLMWRDF